jgi:hypothetical protein
MTTKTEDMIQDRPMTTGPIDVQLGKRIVTDKRDYFPYPRQSFPINRQLLLANGYGEAAIETLEDGYWITYRDLPLTGPDCDILEFPDGRRYATKLEFLGGETVSIEIIKRLSNSAR